MKQHKFLYINIHKNKNIKVDTKKKNKKEQNEINLLKKIIRSE